MKGLLAGLGSLLFFSQVASASLENNIPAHVAQPTNCITSEFSSTGDQWWRNIVMKLTNNCGVTVDFQNMTVNFQNTIVLDTTFWGDFGPLSYPDNLLQLSSQPLPNGNHLVHFNLHFPTYQGANSKLPAGSSIFIKYGAKIEGHVPGTTEVFLGNQVDVGKIDIHLQVLPPELSGYTANPNATLTENGGSSSITTGLNWNATTHVTQLKNGSTYQFFTPVITFNGYQCQPTFNPTSLIASMTPPLTNLTFSCQKLQSATITINVNGAPQILSSLKITFTPNNNGSPVAKVVPLSNGSGSSTVLLTSGQVYNVSSDPVPDYSINFNPQPLTAINGAIETITLATGTPVSLNGQLKVCGTQICNEHDVPIQLKGMSSHGIQWYGLNKCLTSASLDAVAKDFKSSVFRIALYVQEGGYETNPAGFTAQVNQLINEATNRGLYALIDWHTLNPGDPNYNLERAKKFFTDIATANKGKNNLLYEIANEPNGVSWSVIKSYADQLIPVIRAIDPKTIILVGTPGWSSLGLADGRSSQDIINNPLNFPNIMYTFHFYAASHKDTYINELDRASNVLPIFASEFGTQTFTGDGENDFITSDRYMTLMKNKKISWTNWNYSDDFRSGAIWKVGTCPQGPWTDANLKPAGIYIKDKIIN